MPSIHGRPHGNAVLVTAADGAYLDQARQLFSSSFFNGNWRHSALLLTNEISKEDRLWFESHGIGVKTLELPIPEADWHNRKFPPIIAIRYHLFGPEFSEWSSVVYLDADVIVMGDLSELITHTGFRAVEDPGIPPCANFAGTDAFRRAHDFVEIDGSREKCFNSGVFSFHTDVCDERLLNRLITLTVAGLPDLTYPDQAILNTLFCGRWRRMPLRLNFLPPGRVLRGLLTNPKYSMGLVLHFMGPHKPWASGHPYNRAWNDSLKKASDLPRVWSEAEVHPSSDSATHRAALLILVGAIRWYRVISRTMRRTAKKVLLRGPRRYTDGCR